MDTKEVKHDGVDLLEKAEDEYTKELKRHVAEMTARRQGEEEKKVSIKDFPFFGPKRLEDESFEEYRLRLKNEKYMFKMRRVFGLHHYNSKGKAPWVNPARIAKKKKNGTYRPKNTVNTGPFFKPTKAYRNLLKRRAVMEEKLDAELEAAMIAERDAREKAALADAEC